MAITGFNIPQAPVVSFSPLGMLYISNNFSDGGFTIPVETGDQAGLMTINFHENIDAQFNDPSPERPVYIIVNDSNAPHLLDGDYVFTLVDVRRTDEVVTSIDILYNEALTNQHRGGGSDPTQGTRTLAQFIADLGTPANDDFLNVHEQDGILGSSTTRISTGGFVQAIYNGNDLATNAEKDGLTVMIAPANGRETSLRLQQGVAIPTDASVINTSADTFTLLINH